MAINGLASPLFIAGFYYKTFMGLTKRSWMLFEPIIRKAAGLGVASTSHDPDVSTNATILRCLRCRRGVAGLAAALSAVQSGARVTLADDRAVFGGSQSGAAGRIDGISTDTWIKTTLARLRELNVTLLARTMVFGYYDNQTLGALGTGHRPTKTSRTGASHVSGCGPFEVKKLSWQLVRLNADGLFR